MSGAVAPWRSLSLRLSAVFIAVLLASALGVGYLFDRGRSEALAERERDHLRLHTERVADEIVQLISQLRSDALFLAGTPPIQGIGRALRAGGYDAAGASSLAQWKERLEQIFGSFAEARPRYFQLRLIGVQDNGRELVRVERTAQGAAVTPPDALQPKGGRYYFQEALVVPPGSVYLSQIDLNREHGRISVPHLPTLRAATPVRNAGGELFGILVVNMDMGWVFARASASLDPTESLYILDERGDFLLHSRADQAFARDLGGQAAIPDGFSKWAQGIVGLHDAEGAFVQPPGTGRDQATFATERAWDPARPERRLLFLLTEPLALILPDTGLMRRESLLGMGALLLLAGALVVIAVRRLTRSLTGLANASAAIAEGDYAVDLPMDESGEVATLVQAFRHMAARVADREEALAELNRGLEQRVAERTAELAQQHALQGLILEHIADGVVVADPNGRFLLWNARAAEIVGSGPEPVSPDSWSGHFGIYRDEGGEPVPAEELPLVRAMGGASTDNVELYLRQPQTGEGRWVQVTARPLRGVDGAVAGGVAVLVDVSEQKRLRRRVDSDRAELARVGRLALGAGIASSAAHELSQPIAALSNYAAAAVRRDQQGRLGADECRDVLTRIESLARQAGEVLNRLRALIRRRQQTPSPVDVNAVAEACLDLMGERIRRQGVRVARRYGRDLPMPICDPVELTHVLVQLVSNALEAMSEAAVGERSLAIETGYDPQMGQIHIEVGDSGPGIGPEQAEGLFEPWQTDKPDALGIGLYVARSILEQRQGAIRIGTSAAGGALFRVELPAGREVST
jgi:PAS domain S-box-containing protein